MTKFSFNQAVPFEATHVGEVIKDAGVKLE